MIFICWLIMAVITLISRWLSGIIVIGDTHPR